MIPAVVCGLIALAATLWAARRTRTWLAQPGPGRHTAAAIAARPRPADDCLSNSQRFRVRLRGAVVDVQRRVEEATA